MSQPQSIWTAPAKRSGDGAFRTFQSGVALRLPPQSKNLGWKTAR